MFNSLIKAAKKIPVEMSIRCSLRRIIINLFTFKTSLSLIELRSRLANESFRNNPELKSLVDDLYLIMVDQEFSDSFGISPRCPELIEFSK